MNNYSLALGAKRDKKDKRDLRLSGIMGAAEIQKQRFVLDDQFGPKNQFQRGSCTSQAQSHHKERQEKKKLSSRFTMALTKQLEGNTNYGGYTRNTFKIANKVGVCSELLYPESSPSMSWEEYIDVSKIPAECYKDAEKHKSESYWRIDLELNAIKQALITHRNSIVISMAWYSEFNRPENGLLPTTYSNYAGGHAVELKGFDDFKEVFVLKNSWGPDWDGANGYFYIPYDMFINGKSKSRSLVWDLWCSLDYPDNLPVDDFYGIQRTWQSFIREKSMAFNPWLRAKIGRLPNNREIKGLAYGFHDWTTVFRGYNGDVWLSKTKPELLAEGFDYKI